MSNSKKTTWQESINLFFAFLVVALPLIIISAFFLNKKYLYLALLIWIGVPIVDYIYRQCGGKGLNENES